MHARDDLDRGGISEAGLGDLEIASPSTAVDLRILEAARALGARGRKRTLAGDRAVHVLLAAAAILVGLVLVWRRPPDDGAGVATAVRCAVGGVDGALPAAAGWTGSESSQALCELRDELDWIGAQSADIPSSREAERVEVVRRLGVCLRDLERLESWLAASGGAASDEAGARKPPARS